MRATSCLYKASNSLLIIARVSANTANFSSELSLPPAGAKGLERKRSCQIACVGTLEALATISFYTLFVSMGFSLQHPWAFAFGLLGNVISFMTFLAPIPTFYRIYKSKSTEGFQSVPYVVALFSAMLWIFYALIKSNEILLITINVAGCVIESIYVIMYFVYADKKARWFTAKIFIGLNVGFFGAIMLFTLLLFKGDKRIVTLGWICVGFSVSVFVAPLSIIRRVIQTRSVEYMPFNLSLSLTLSAVVWFLYGLLIKDKYVALPNVLGFTFGVVQMGLYMFYMNKTPLIPEGKIAAGKLPATGEAVTEMAVPRSCKAEAMSHHSPAVNMV